MWFIDFWKICVPGLQVCITPCRQLMLLKVTLDPLTLSILYSDNSNRDAKRISEVARIPELLSFLISLRKYFLFIIV